MVSTWRGWGPAVSTRSFTLSFTDSLTRSLTHSLTHSNRSLMHFLRVFDPARDSPVLAHPLTHPLTHSATHSLTYCVCVVRSRLTARGCFRAVNWAKSACGTFNPLVWWLNSHALRLTQFRVFLSREMGVCSPQDLLKKWTILPCSPVLKN